MIEEDAAGGGRGEASDHAEEGCFTAAGRAEEEKEFAGGNVEGNVVDDREITERFGEVEEGDRGHGVLEEELGSDALDRSDALDGSDTLDRLEA